MDESSNKSLVKIIKRLLQESKKAWDSKLKYALWADIISTKRSIGTAPYHLVYRMDVVFPISLGSLVMKLLQEQEGEPSDMQRRINHLIEAHELRERIYLTTQDQKTKVKNKFDRRTKLDDFQVDDLVLRWDAMREKKGMHGKFNHLWVGPLKIATRHTHNDFILKEFDITFAQGGPVNKCFLKHYIT